MFNIDTILLSKVLIETPFILQKLYYQHKWRIQKLIYKLIYYK